MAPILYPPTLLSADQVLQHAYDEPTQTLRTTATAIIVGQPISVEIDMADDSIRLGDGINFFTSTTVGPDVGLDVFLINPSLQVTATDLDIRDLSHLTDSVRLGDGTSFLTSTTVGLDVGLDVNIINSPLDVNTNSNAANPTVYNVSAAVAGTEYSQALPVGTKKLMAKIRNATANMQFSYVAGTTGTVYVRVGRGVVYEETGLNTTSVVTFYFQTDQAAQTLELIAWT